MHPSGFGAVHAHAAYKLGGKVNESTDQVAAVAVASVLGEESHNMAQAVAVGLLFKSAPIATVPVADHRQGFIDRRMPGKEYSMPEFRVVTAATGGPGSEPFVEPSKIECGPASNCHIGARADVPDRHASPPVPHELRIEAERQNPHPAEAEFILKADLGICLQRLRQHKAANHPDIPFLEASQQWRNPARFRSHVVVDEDNDVARGGRDSGIAGTAEASTRFNNVSNTRMRPDHRFCLGVWSIVDNDNFPARSDFVADRSEAHGEILRPMASANHDRGRNADRSGAALGKHEVKAGEHVAFKVHSRQVVGTGPVAACGRRLAPSRMISAIATPTWLAAKVANSTSVIGRSEGNRCAVPTTAPR